MTISEVMRQTVKNYIDENGIGTIVTKQELFSRANEIMTIKYESFLPADYCYNRTNNGIIYTNQIHLLEIVDDGNYKVLGENYPYNGGVFINGDVKGYWTDGIFSEDIPDFYYRLSDLSESLSRMLKNATVQTENRDVIVMADDKELCRISVMDETYKISTNVSEWKERTTYLCTEANGITEYYVDRIDECIGEIKRLVKCYVSMNTVTRSSELSKIITADVFKRAYAKFIEQADKNAVSGKGEGGKTPYGFTAKPTCDNANVGIHFGQGGASKTPYMNWWVVSIYYVVKEKLIILGIEEDRYPHIKEMHPIGRIQIGNKKTMVAVFYKSTKDNIDYDKLHRTFIKVSEEVMRLGLK